MKKKSVRRTSYSIVDGDTIRVTRNIKGSHFVRLSGIDTPEKREPDYQKAKGQLKRLLAGNPITITPQAIRRNRVIGIIRAKRKNVNRAMKNKGY